MLKISTAMLFRQRDLGANLSRLCIQFLSKAEALNFSEAHKAETNISLKNIEFDSQSKTHQAKASATAWAEAG